jgi:hypothetical protein
MEGLHTPDGIYSEVEDNLCSFWGRNHRSRWREDGLIDSLISSNLALGPTSYYGQ